MKNSHLFKATCPHDCPDACSMEVEIDEVWYDKVMDKLTRTSHPKGWDKMVNKYVELMKTDKYKGNPHAAALDIVRQTRNVKARTFITYINKIFFLNP